MAPTQKPITPLLDLSTETPARLVIKIDGESYTLRRFDDFSILDSQQVIRDIQRMFELGDAALTPKRRRSRQAQQAAENAFNAVVLKIVKAVLVAPPALVRKLTANQCGDIVTVFIRLSLTSAEAVKALAGLRPDGRKSGSTSSPSSRGSTVATRSTGGSGSR